MPAPPLPRVEVKSASGKNAETHIALPGTPEHDKYLEAKDRYKHAFGLALQRFTVNYGVVAWRSHPGEPIQFDPPEGWTIPPILEEYGEVALEGPERRAQYILYELILTDADLLRVELATLPGSPVTKEDVVAAMAPFDSSMKASPSSTDNPPLQEKAQAQE